MKTAFMSETELEASFLLFIFFCIIYVKKNLYK